MRDPNNEMGCCLRIPLQATPGNVSKAAQIAEKILTDTGIDFEIKKLPAGALSPSDNNQLGMNCSLEIYLEWDPAEEKFKTMLESCQSYIRRIYMEFATQNIVVGEAAQEKYFFAAAGVKPDEKIENIPDVSLTEEMLELEYMAGDFPEAMMKRKEAINVIEMIKSIEFDSNSILDAMDKKTNSIIESEITILKDLLEGYTAEYKAVSPRENNKLGINFLNNIIITINNFHNGLFNVLNLGDIPLYKQLQEYCIHQRAIKENIHLAFIKEHIENKHGPQWLHDNLDKIQEINKLMYKRDLRLFHAESGKTVISRKISEKIEMTALSHKNWVNLLDKMCEGSCTKKDFLMFLESEKSKYGFLNNEKSYIGLLDQVKNNIIHSEFKINNKNKSASVYHSDFKEINFYLKQRALRTMDEFMAPSYEGYEQLRDSWVKILSEVANGTLKKDKLIDFINREADKFDTHILTTNPYSTLLRHLSDKIISNDIPIRNDREATLKYLNCYNLQHEYSEILLDKNNGTTADDKRSEYEVAWKDSNIQKMFLNPDQLKAICEKNSGRQQSSRPTNLLWQSQLERHDLQSKLTEKSNIQETQNPQKKNRKNT